MVAFFKNDIDQAQYDNEHNNIKPLYAVVFHGNKKMVAACTKHRISKTCKLSLGQIISPQALKKNFSELNTEGFDSGENTFIPKNIVLNDEKQIAWHKKRFVSEIWYRRKGGIESLTVEWPALLFVAQKRERSLRVFALPSNSRPQPRTKLYNAPFMNIDEDGKLCLGSAKMPPEITIRDIEECEATLINSQFTHTNHDHTLKKETDDDELYEFWRKHSGRNPTRVKMSDLKQYGRLEDLYSGSNA